MVMSQHLTSLQAQAADDATSVDAYKTYLKHELRENSDPARVTCLFERALTRHCLVPDLWERYGKYLVSTYFVFVLLQFFSVDQLL